MDLSVSLAPEVIFNIGSFGVTNTLFWSVMISTFISSITLFVRFNLKTVPGVLQNLVEGILEESYKFVRSIVGTEKKAKRAYPFVFTIFIFVLFGNLMAFIPGAGAIKVLKETGDVSLFRVITSDYALILMLTMVSVITMQIVAISTHGPLGYIKKFINLKGPLDFFLGLMDIIGELAKVLSLSFRLFGNMFAGEVLGAVILLLFPFILPLPFAFLGLITALIQAFVFSLLTLIFINMASEIDENEHIEAGSL